VPLTYKDVTEILRIIDESDVEELVLELEDAKLVVRRHGSGTERAVTTAELNPEPAPKASGGNGVEPAAEAEPKAEPAPPKPAPRTDGATEIRAPMVGTFYRRPAPQDPPFVELGGDVAAGDPLCLVEVMKLFTTIEAPVAGRIVEINAENEALVEIDQLLFVIEPA
jgi:acetyl-CoA carboxylase biotin carboxyl carrier protein